MKQDRTAQPLTAAHMAGLVAGNVLEFYDFGVFAFFAPQIGRSMFASAGGSDGLLPALATFAVGFLARPIGAGVIGRYADRAGRKPAMVLSFALMGAALLAVALTPPARMIGVWSAVILALARLVQGFALGGEVGPTTALLIEAAPPHRRGFYGAWQHASQGIAVLLAGAVGLTITTLLSPPQVIDWGWRIAMLLGATVLPIGFALRRIIPETLAVPERTDAPQAPLRRVVICGVLLVLAGTVTTYTLQYLNTYSITTLKVPPRTAFMMTAVTGSSMFAACLIGGSLSDRLGRWPLIVFPRLVLLLAIGPIFVQILHAPRLGTLALGAFVLTSLYSLSTSPANVWVAESLPRSSRSTGYALIYTLAVSVFGGGAQFLITWLIKRTGDAMMPAWWLIGATVIGIAAGSTIPIFNHRRYQA
jgi:MFS transporter, MHS family, citrate/tricarballylate:H+ symporter